MSVVCVYDLYYLTNKCLSKHCNEYLDYMKKGNSEIVYDMKVQRGIEV
jgi:regulator of sigma D